MGLRNARRICARAGCPRRTTGRLKRAARRIATKSHTGRALGAALCALHRSVTRRQSSMAALLQRPLAQTRPGHPRLLDSATMPVIKAWVRTELVRRLKTNGTSPATGMSFTFAAPPEPLMPDATAPVSLACPSASAASFAHTAEIEPQSALIRFTHRVRHRCRGQSLPSRSRQPDQVWVYGLIGGDSSIAPTAAIRAIAIRRPGSGAAVTRASADDRIAIPVLVMEKNRRSMPLLRTLASQQQCLRQQSRRI